MTGNRPSRAGLITTKPQPKTTVWVRTHRTVLLTFLAAALWGTNAEAANGRGGGRGAGVVWQGTVVKVVDGDSLHIKRAGKKVNIRLNGVDTPEYGQPWGQQATAFTRKQVMGKRVIVVEKERDQYGRIVAT